MTITTPGYTGSAFFTERTSNTEGFVPRVLRDNLCQTISSFISSVFLVYMYSCVVVGDLIVPDPDVLVTTDTEKKMYVHTYISTNACFKRCKLPCAPCFGDRVISARAVTHKRYGGETIPLLQYNKLWGKTRHEGRERRERDGA